MTKNNNQDFVNASLIAKLPIEMVLSLIAVIIFVFSMYVSYSLLFQNQPQTLDGVLFYKLPEMIAFVLVFPFIVSLLSTYFAVSTGRADVDLVRSLKLTTRLQWSLSRQPGSSVGAQGALARRSNVRRLSSFVWVRKFSDEIDICVRQDLRQDVNSLVDDRALKEIANDIAEITGKTYTGYVDKVVNDKLIFNHYKRYRVAKLV